jgi:hypothetical protein
MVAATFPVSRWRRGGRLTSVGGDGGDMSVIFACPGEHGGAAAVNG